ncbi:MAG TPA: 4-(cytidine 5'-diphospho)-2-C-methyl-D-erythritol kinase [Cyclobacteriaceae bacterium]|nr:4-(cytidine 5'-diphospho)-2-C-methyl-D-erythritol kinase [Cyclobacteriaceae bacterium]
MVSFPPCKINLGLQILSKQPDGYHAIATCFYPLPWTDILEILPSTHFDFTSSGIQIPGQSGENLCVKAYELIKKDFQLPPVRMHLHKIIPAGAGLGGGSADAAYTLRSLNALFDLKLLQNQLMQYAAQLGSDVPFFIQDEPKLGKGRGNLLEPVDLNLKGCFIRLFKPDFSISTAEAYARVVPCTPSQDIRKIIEAPMTLWKNNLLNDFESSLFPGYSILQKIKNELYDSGAVYASMSGSGSSLFGIFAKVPPAFTYSLEPSWSGML